MFEFKRPETAFSLSGRNGQKKRPRVTNDAHLKFIRRLPSLVPGEGPVEAAHIRYADSRYRKPAVGMAEKPDDKYVIPLAASEHRKQHDMDEREYWKSVGIDPVLVAILLFQATGDEEEGEAIIQQFGGSR